MLNKNNKINIKNENVHSGHRKRMRTRLNKNGPDTMEDHELIEMLLYYCVPMKDTNEIAHKMLSAFGSMTNLIKASPQEIVKRCDVTENMAMIFSTINGIIKRVSAEAYKQGHIISSTDEAGNLAVSILNGESVECFYVVCLDGKNRIIAIDRISKGVINETYVNTRMVVESVLGHNARSAIFMHNHPSGILKPSFEDIYTTNKIVKVLNAIDIIVLDHLIVAENKYFSMADNEMLKNSIPEEE